MNLFFNLAWILGSVWYSELFATELRLNLKIDLFDVLPTDP